MLARVCWSLLLAVILAVAVAQTAGAVPMRYCDRPGKAGQYVAASRNVGCSKARRVEAHMFSDACITKRRCQAEGFTCRSYWNGSYANPFSFSHHGICNATRKRRIEFDGG